MLKRNTLRKKKGQSTVEYIILVAAILAALLVFLKPDGVFQNRYKNALTDGTDGMNVMSQRLKASRPAATD